MGDFGLANAQFDYDNMLPREDYIITEEEEEETEPAIVLIAERLRKISDELNDRELQDKLDDIYDELLEIEGDYRL